MTLTNSLGWALLHFLWQGAALGIILRIALAVTPQRRSGWRYFVSVTAMLAMPVLVIATTIRGYDPPPHSLTRPATSAMVTNDLPTIADPIGTRPTHSSVRPTEIDRVAPSAQPTAREWLARQVSWLVLLWYGGVLLFGLRLARGWSGARALTRRDLVETPASWLTMAAALAERAGVRRAVRVVVSTRARVAVVIGWLEPVIVAPAAALSGLTPTQVQLLLAHELVHIRRHDYLVNLLQCLIEVLLFYHPVIWWMSRTIREEREHCCDDIVVSLGGDALTYAEALLAMEQLRLTSHPRLALAATGGTLVNRVRRLLEPSVDRPSLPMWRTGIMAASAATLLVVGGRWSTPRSPSLGVDSVSNSAIQRRDVAVPLTSPPKDAGKGQQHTWVEPGPGDTTPPAAQASSTGPASAVVLVARATDTRRDHSPSLGDSPLTRLKWLIDTVDQLNIAFKRDPTVQVDAVTAYTKPLLMELSRLIDVIDDLQGEWTLDGQLPANLSLTTAAVALDSARARLYGLALHWTLDKLRVAYDALQEFSASDPGERSVAADSADRAIQAIDELRKTALYPVGSHPRARVAAINELARLGRLAAARQWNLPTGPNFGRPSERIVAFLNELAGREHEVPETQQAAIDALASIGTTSSLNVLVELAERHPTIWVRAHALTAYGSSRRLYNAIPFFLRRLEDESSRVVQTTILGLLANQVRQSVASVGDVEIGIEERTPTAYRSKLALNALIDVTRNHRDKELRKMAVDFLAEVYDAEEQQARR